MAHYKDTENKLHFLGDAAFEHLLPAGCVQISEEEAEAIRAANAPTPDHSALRAAAYREESDPLFFKEQRGEVPSGTWLEKVEEIKARWPK